MNNLSPGMRIARYREMLVLHNHFQNYFKVVPAVNPELVLEAQRIRHSVYCEELEWESCNGDGLEVDSYDEHSLHCLLLAVRSQKYIGCVRLVLPKEGDPVHSFPLQELCVGRLYPGHPDLNQMINGEVAEVSRLAIISDYRRRKNESHKPVPLDLDQDVIRKGRRRFPYIPVGLYIGMLEMASIYGIKNLYLVTEHMLAVHFSRLGGNLTPVGDVVEHRGKRRPYMMDVERVLKDAHLFLRPLIWTIRKDIRSSLKESGVVRDTKNDLLRKNKWREREAT